MQFYAAFCGLGRLQTRIEAHLLLTGSIQHARLAFHGVYQLFTLFVTEDGAKPA